jgi:signal transduction histidine kinase
MISILKLMQRKVFFSLLILVALYSIANCYIIKWIVTPSQLQVERKLAQQEMERFTEALTRELKVLDTMAHDWGAWNDTYTFVQDRNSEYITSNLNNDTLIGCEINLLYIFDAEGVIIWSRLIDLETHEQIVIKEIPSTGIPQDHPLLFHASSNSSITGLQKTASGPLLLASHPIITSLNKGPIVGTLVFGRLLTAQLFTKLREQTKVYCSLISFNNTIFSEPLQEDIASIGPDKPYVFRETAFEILVYSLLKDYQGQSKWLLEVHADRSLTSQSRRILHYVFFSNSIIGFFTLLLFLYLYRTQIRTATATFRHLIEQSLPPSSPKTEPKKYWELFTTNEFSKLSQDLRLMIAEFETASCRHKNIISQHTTSLRDLNELLVDEVKKRFQIEENLHSIQMDLEKQVAIRTRELRLTNKDLHDEIVERKKNEIVLREQRQRLRNLSSELMDMEDRERRQLATDLHDQIGQSLTVVKLYLDTLHDQRQDDNTQKTLQQIATLVEQTIQDTRTLTFELSPPILYELGLDAALEWLAENLQQKYHVEVLIRYDAVLDDASPAFLALVFRTIRELLMNVIQHAAADHAKVHIWCRDNSLYLRVADNGRGMKLVESTSVGFGLFSIRERVINIGGAVDIASQSNAGTTISLRIPLPEGCLERDNTIT